MEELNTEPIGQFTRMVQLFRKDELKTDEAVELTELIGNMASENIIARFESKLDAVNAKYNLLIGLVSAGLTLAVAIIGWLLATA